MLNTLIAAGFEYGVVNEWKPSDQQFAAHPEWRATELTRPMFLLMSLTKPARRDT